MGTNRRKVYGEGEKDGEKACPRCGCRHLEAVKVCVAGKWREIRTCRNCGTLVA